MCLGVPGKIVWVGEDKAGVDFGDVVVEAATHIVDKDELAVGDFVIVHCGYILEKLDIKEAEETLKLFSEFYKKEVTDESA